MTFDEDYFYYPKLMPPVFKTVTVYNLTKATLLGPYTYWNYCTMAYKILFKQILVQVIIVEPQCCYIIIHATILSLFAKTLDS